MSSQWGRHALSLKRADRRNSESLPPPHLILSCPWDIQVAALREYGYLVPRLGFVEYSLTNVLAWSACSKLNHYFTIWDNESTPSWSQLAVAGMNEQAVQKWNLGPMLPHVELYIQKRDFSERDNFCPSHLHRLQELAMTACLYSRRLPSILPT